MIHTMSFASFGCEVKNDWCDLRMMPSAPQACSKSIRDTLLADCLTLDDSGAMSDTGKDGNPLEKAGEKVGDTAAAAAEAAKEKAAHLQPGGSQVGDVSSCSCG